MVISSSQRLLRTIHLLITVCLVGFPVYAKYGGGTGEPDEPYLIGTPEDLNAIGTEPNDWDKHFKLMADIDLAGYAETSFNMIGKFMARPFIGVFDGNGKCISNFNYRVLNATHPGIGLFAEIRGPSQIKNLKLENATVMGGPQGQVGPLVGLCQEGGLISNCHVKGGTVSGQWAIGGLAGLSKGRIVNCSSSANISSGDGSGGGLLGDNSGEVIKCHTTGRVSVRSCGGGLVGENSGTLTDCYSTSDVSASKGYAGGLAAYHSGVIRNCYSIGSVSSPQCAGGLVGEFSGGGIADNSYWDTQTSGLSISAGGTGKSTAPMHQIDTYSGWNFEEVWKIDPCDYPRLRPGDPPRPRPVVRVAYSGGDGTAKKPFKIATAADLILLGDHPEDFKRHFVLTADIDLAPDLPGRKIFDRAVIAVNRTMLFTGVFDGGGHTISNLTIEGKDALGLVGYLHSGAKIMNLGLLDVDITGDASVGALVGWCRGGVNNCYSTGNVSGNGRLGGLVGQMRGGSIARCYSTAAVRGSTGDIGGLAGYNNGIVFMCFGAGRVSGPFNVGGLIGLNQSDVIHCYSTSVVRGDRQTGGLIGRNFLPKPRDFDNISFCFSAGSVRGNSDVGGLLGQNIRGGAASCFWDKQATGQALSAAGTGKTTKQMRTAGTFLDAGWDFVHETANGTKDVWWIIEGQDYPRLWWE